MIKLLVIVYSKEKRLKILLKKYGLEYQLMSKAMGTASNKILEYLGLNKVEKKIFYSLIPNKIEKNIINDLKFWCNIEKDGRGIAFTISLNSSSKFIKDKLDKDCENMNSKCEYELIITIVSEGYSDLVMKAAASAGCSGGTVINGRSVGSHGTIFMDLSLEPEKEMVLNIVPKKIKRQVMEKITKECGVKTLSRGILISIPLDNVVGLNN